MNLVVLLTACISPNGMCYTKLQDPLERRLQYEQALLFYLESTSLKIVFAENTGTYIGDKYAKYINEGRLEFITFIGNNFPVELGKGYGEAIIIKEAFDKSVLIQNSDYVVKITGRLMISNISKLLGEIMLNLESNKLVAASVSPKVGIAYSHFFVGHKSFFNQIFFDCMKNANDSQGIYFEHILYQQIKVWLDNKGFFYIFLRSINTIGFSGSTGESYLNCSSKEKIKLYLRNYFLNIRICIMKKL